MNEQEVREHVIRLRRFYEGVFIYLAVNAFFIIVWAISGMGYFWPIWSIIGWGIGLGVHAFSLGLIPQMTAMIPFMTADWEDDEVRRIMEAKKNGNSPPRARSSESTASTEKKAAPAKKTTKRKAPAKKTTSKK